MLASAIEPTPVQAGGPSGQEVPEEELLRAGAYGLLAELLRDAPSDAVLARLRTVHSEEEPGEDAVATALRLLGLSARDAHPATLADEYHVLFIGIGRGELVPFGSWYLTGFLMERPLSLLRDDLARLGFERASDVHEPEDHVAALCEVMALLIRDGAAHEVQQAFFEQHLAPWFGRFFADLQAAQAACFYRAVGRFGSAFTELEQRYFSMRV